MLEGAEDRSAWSDGSEEYALRSPDHTRKDQCETHFEDESSKEYFFESHLEKTSVTDPGSPISMSHEIVTSTAIEGCPERLQTDLRKAKQTKQVQCDFCGSWCGPFARRRPWHRGR